MFGTNAATVALSILMMLPSCAAMPMEKMISVPAGWSVVGEPDPSAAIALQIGLKLSNLDQLDSKLYSISTPGSVEYGMFLTKDEIEQIFAPCPNAPKAVGSWLQKHNISSTNVDAQWIHIDTTVALANKLLGARFYNFANNAGIIKMRTREYSVPDAVACHIDLIAPTVHLSHGEGNAVTPQRKQFLDHSAAYRMPPKREPMGHRTYKYPPKRGYLAINQSQPWNSSCSLDGLTPQCLRQLYNVGNYTPDAACGSTVAFSSFFNNSASFADLSLYQSRYGIPHQEIAHVQTMTGGIDSQAGWGIGEANVDSQLISAMSHPLPTVEIIAGSTSYAVPSVSQPAPQNRNEPWIPFFRHLLNSPSLELPRVVSISYGEDEHTVPVRYARHVCNAIGLLGLRGVSVLVSSGDSGLGADCISNDGRNRSMFEPHFPATCPYITSVGGTAAINPEVAWEGSGGGFSNYFPRPQYQDTTIRDYFDKHVSNETKAYYKPYYNHAGRGFPDLAAHSDFPGLKLFLAGHLLKAGGTSASAPIVAGVVAMLNDARLRDGRPPMGFLNPWLYSLGHKGLHDITEGSSSGCNGTNLQSGANVSNGALIPGAHWNATEGWDPVTGLGTPDFQKLLHLALLKN